VARHRPTRARPHRPLLDGVVYIGDAARVVEPFTGEGIYYALQSASLAARHIIDGTLTVTPPPTLPFTGAASGSIASPAGPYHPRAGALLLRALSAHPAPMRFLVARITAPHPLPAAA